MEEDRALCGWGVNPVVSPVPARPGRLTVAESVCIDRATGREDGESGGLNAVLLPTRVYVPNGFHQVGNSIRWSWVDWSFFFFPRGDQKGAAVVALDYKSSLVFFPSSSSLGSPR